MTELASATSIIRPMVTSSDEAKSDESIPSGDKDTREVKSRRNADRSGKLRLEMCTVDTNYAERSAIEAADRLRRPAQPRATKLITAAWKLYPRLPALEKLFLKHLETRDDG